MRQRLSLAFTALFVLGGSLTPCAAQQLPANEVWEYSPYRVAVWLAIEDASQLNAAIRARVSTRLTQRADAIARGSWKEFTLTPPPRKLRLDLLRRLSDFDVQRIEDHLAGRTEQGAQTVPTKGEKKETRSNEKFDNRRAPADIEFDKVLVISIQQTSREFRVTCRDFDLMALVGSPAFSQAERNLQRLPAACVEAMMAAFTPLARIEKTKGVSAQTRVRAAGLIRDRRNPSKIAVGDVLLPVVRRKNRQGKTLQVMSPPWTYLVVRERRRFRTTSQIVSGISRPLGRRSTHLTQMYAMGVRPPGTTTEIILQTRADPPLPMPGYEVTARLIGDKMPVRKPGEVKTELPSESLGVTDWRGAIEVGPGGDSPLRLLFVRSGGINMARLPIVPGRVSQLQANIRSDGQRLQAEGAVRSLQTELIDVVARRTVYSVRIRNRLEEKKVAEARELFKQLSSLPTRNDFDVRLNQQRRRFRGGDARTKDKIDRLFYNTEALVSKFLTSDEFKQLKDEIDRAAPSG